MDSETWYVAGVSRFLAYSLLGYEQWFLKYKIDVSVDNR